MVMALNACAVTQHPLTPTAAANLKGRRLRTTVRPQTPLVVYPPSGRGFVMIPAMLTAGPVGALVAGLSLAGASADMGTHIIRQNGLVEPAATLAQELGDDLGRRYGLTIERQTIYIDDDDVTRIALADPSADVVLDVWLNRMSLDRLPKSETGYGFSYGAYLRLIDAKVVHPIDGKKGIVLARGSCSRAPDESLGAPTYDDFLADGAQRLKHEMDLAVQFCVDQFRSAVLNVPR
jgi:hypothetical protein